MQVALFIVLLSSWRARAGCSSRPLARGSVRWNCYLALVFFVAAIVYLRPMKIAAKQRARST